MKIDFLLMSEIGVLPELFLGISIIYLLLHSTFLSIRTNYPLIQSSVIFLGSLTLFLAFYLLLNDSLNILGLTYFNDTIINDYLSFIVKSSIVVLAFFCLLTIKNYLISQQLNNFEYVLLILFSVLGLFLLCSSNDLITAYLSIELQSLSFYVLASFKKNSSFSVDAGIKYFIVGALSSSLFLFGASFLYCSTGTVCFSDFNFLFAESYYSIVPMTWYEFVGFSFMFVVNGGSLKELHYSFGEFDLFQLGLALILISLLLKLAVAPFHIWAPNVYENSPSSSTFFFAVVPKLAIFVLLTRIFYFSFNSHIDNFRDPIAIIAILTVIVGSFGGLEQRKLKSLLVYSSISHMGYSLISFSVGTFESIQILFCYLIIYSFSGLCIWTIFISTQLKSSYFQKQNKDLTDLVSLSKSNNTLALIFTVVLFSVAGFPPMIGFLVKISVFLTAIEVYMFFVALICILCSVIGTFYYIRIVKILFFEKTLSGKLFHPINYINSTLIAFLFYFFIFLFVNPTLLFLFSYKLSLLSMGLGT